MALVKVFLCSSSFLLTSSSSAGVSGFLSVKLSAPSYINYKVGGTYSNLTGTLPDGKTFTVCGVNSDDSSIN